MLGVAGFYRWGDDVELIPEYSFLAEVPFDAPIQLSDEHAKYRWCDLQRTLEPWKWDSNKRALNGADSITRLKGLPLPKDSDESQAR